MRSRQTGPQSHLDGTLDLSLTQSDPDDVSLPANTAIAPLVFAGDADAVASRRGFGAFEGTLRGSLGRSLHGVTTLDDSSTVDNTAENDWRVGAGARLGFRLTPQLTPFIDGGVEWQRFDAPSPTLLAYLDAVTWSGRTGLSYQHNSTRLGRDRGRSRLARLCRSEPHRCGERDSRWLDHLQSQ